MQQVSLSNSIEENEGMTTKEIALYAGLVAAGAFATTFVTMYALRKMQK